MTPQAPHVHLRAIILFPPEIAPGRHRGGSHKTCPVCSLVAEPKVANLDGHVAIQEEVLGLESDGCG